MLSEAELEHIRLENDRLRHNRYSGHDSETIDRLLADILELHLMLRDVETRGVKAGMEAAAKKCEENFDPAHCPNCHEQDAASIRAIDPASILPG